MSSSRLPISYPRWVLGSPHGPAFRVTRKGIDVSLTRRHLLVAGGIATAASLGSPRTASGASPAPPPLPPPLPPDAFRERQERLRADAKARGLDVVVVTPSTNLGYLANLAIGRSERLTALLLFSDGPSVLVTPSFEEANHRKTIVVDD